VQEKERSRQGKEISRQDSHVSTPLAGQGFPAPSFVCGSGGYTRQHCGQRAVSAATFKFASVSTASFATSTLPPPAVTVACPVLRRLTIVTTQAEAANIMLESNPLLDSTESNSVSPTVHCSQFRLQQYQEPFPPPTTAYTPYPRAPAAPPKDDHVPLSDSDARKQLGCCEILGYRTQHSAVQRPTHFTKPSRLDTCCWRDLSVSSLC
jgi:hypothetical protein